MPEIARTSSSLRTSFGRLVNSASVTQRFFTSQFNATSFTIRSSIFCFFRSGSVSRFNQTVGFMITTLLVFLQLKYLTNDNKTPFTTHPYTMGVAVYSAFMYYLACYVHLQYSLRRFSVLSHNCMVWFGDISVASLMSIFLPDWVRPILYVVFGLISASEFLLKLFVEETGGPFWVQRRRIRRFWDGLGRLCFVGKSTYTSHISKSKSTQICLLFCIIYLPIV